MVEVTLLIVLAQVGPPVDTSGFSPEQRFWYAMASLIVPIVVGALAFAGSILAFWQSRQAARTASVAVQKVDANTALTAATQAEVGVVSKKVDGHSAELREYAERAGRAEGKAEALEQVGAGAPVVPPVQVVIDPDAQPGGRRKLDPPAPIVPPDQNSETHLP